MNVRLCVCLSVREDISATMRSIIMKCLLHVACNRGSAFFWWRCDKLCTSGFMGGDVVFVNTCNRPKGRILKATQQRAAWI